MGFVMSLMRRTHALAIAVAALGCAGVASAQPAPRAAPESKAQIQLSFA
jgi:hypothetical protein